MPFTTPRMYFAKKNSQVFQKLSTKNTLEILELLLYIEWSQTFQKYLKQQNIFQLSQFESFYCWTVIITYRVSQKYITRNSSYSLKCQFLLHSWYFLMKLLLISVQLEHFKEFERNIDQVRCPKNANIYVKFLFQLPPLPLILLFSRAGVNTQTHLYIPRNGRIGIYDQFGC